MRFFRTGAVAIALVAASIATAAGAAGVTTTDCRVRLDGTWTSGGSFRGNVRPHGERPSGNGTVQHVAGDGRRFLLHATTLLCRRDGGPVPEHGGANIADFTGTGRLFAGGKPVPVGFQIHVEDRGGRTRPEGGFEDYYAIQVLDQAGNEIYFEADYLATGGVELIPTRP